MADIGQVQQSIFFKLNNRSETRIYTVDPGQPITIIGGSLSILTDNSETIDMVISTAGVKYTILSNYRINNDFPDTFIKAINRMTLEAGTQILLTAKNSFGVTTNPDIHGYLSFIKQPKLS